MSRHLWAEDRAQEGRTSRSRSHRTSPPRGWSMDASIAPLLARLARATDGRALLPLRSQLRNPRQRRRAVRRQPTARFVEHALLAPLPRARSRLACAASAPQVVVSSFDGVACTALTTLGVPGATTTATGARVRARPAAPTTHDSRTRRAAARSETDAADTIASDERAAHELVGDGPTSRCAPRPLRARATAAGAAARAALQQP